MEQSSKKSLPADERIWPLKPEVLLARGKCELQGKEEQAIRAAISEAITTYRETAASLGDSNLEDRKTIASLLVSSAEDAEQILLQRCTYDRSKTLKYRGKDAEDVAENIDEEIAILKNILNILSNRRKQKTKTLLDQQKLLASLEVTGDLGGIEFPEEEQRCRQFECQIEKVNQKMGTATSVKEKYHEFIDTLGLEKRFYEARLRRLKEFILADIRDLETCHDIMTKGYILEQDSSNKLEDQTTKYVNGRKERKRDIEEIRKEVHKRLQEHPSRKKMTVTEVAINKMMLINQDFLSKIQDRRKTLVELGFMQDDMEVLQRVTRRSNAADVVKQFEEQAARNEYLSREQENVRSKKEEQLNQLKNKQTILSSIRNTGEQAKIALDSEIAGLESVARVQKARRQAAEQHLRALGLTLTATRTSAKQMLRALRCIPRPADWPQNDGEIDTVGDLALLEYKIGRLQDQFESLGAPLRLESRDSIQSTALEAPKKEFRIGKMGQEPLLSTEAGKVDDMQGMRSEMKNFSEGYVIKMSRNKRR